MASTVLSPAAGDGTSPARHGRQDVRVVSARKSMGTRVKEVWQYRELLNSLVRKELKVKYKDSVLGFFWSMLNPALRLAIFYFVFKYVVPNGIPLFAVYLLSGLLVWSLFNDGLAAATGSVVGNGSIIKKVSFPRKILPLAAIGAAVVNFFLQLVVLFAALIIFRHVPSLAYSSLLVPALFAVILLGAALGVFFSALNVPFRDTEHLLDVGLLVWFWFTPIVYQPEAVLKKLGDHGVQWLFYLNPMVSVVMSFQRAIYNRTTVINDRDHTSVIHVLPNEPVLWYMWHIGAVVLASLIILWGALSYFGRIEGNFAEEL